MKTSATHGLFQKYFWLSRENERQSDIQQRQLLYIKSVKVDVLEFRCYCFLNCSILLLPLFYKEWLKILLDL